MVESIFTWLSQLVESTLILSLLGAFLWGILSVILSPCHLSSIPLIIGFISNQGKISVKKAFTLSLSFSIGILLTIGMVGIITAFMGRMLGDIGKLGNYFVAGIFFLVGLYLLDILKINIPGISNIKIRKKGLGPAFLLGLVFGIALGPCTFAYLAPVLAVAFSSSSTNILNGILLLVFYGIGHCLVIVLAGTFTEMIQRYLKWTEKSKGSIIIKRICGGLVIIGGIYLLTL